MSLTQPVISFYIPRKLKLSLASIFMPISANNFFLQVLVIFGLPKPPLRKLFTNSSKIALLTT